jgi:predicted transposase YbfD/YdcC
MGCQREIAKKIVDKKADYVLALKGNKVKVHCATMSRLSWPSRAANGFKDTKLSGTKRSTAIMAASKPELTRRFYITSLVWLAYALGPFIRSHWSIENSLHSVMDMIFRDRECRHRSCTRQLHYPKAMAHNLIRKAPGKDSLRLKRKVAAWDDDLLASLVAA